MAFAGKCVLLDDSGSSHLWIVITDGAGTPPQIIASLFLSKMDLIR